MSTFDRQWARRLSLGAPPPRPFSPSTEDRCACGHGKGQHHEEIGRIGTACAWVNCECNEYRPFPPSEDAMRRAYEAAGRPVAPPSVGELPDEWQPDPSAPRRLWHVRSCTMDGTPAPPSGTWPSYLPGEALQAVVAQARAEGWPIGQLRWTVTPSTEEPAP